MNVAAKMVIRRLLVVGGIASAGWAVWMRFSRRPLRPGLLHLATVSAIAAASLVADSLSSGRRGCCRDITRLPDGLSFCCIALTFDGGPDAQNTPVILDTLNSAGAKATFFVQLENVAKNPVLTRRIVEEGHTLGVCGVDGESMAQWTPEQVEHALKMMRREVGADLPQIRLFRPPQGLKSRAMRHAVSRMGMTMVTWSLDPRDESCSPGELVKRIANRAGHGDIVLLHDRSESTAEAIGGIVKRLTGKGFHLVRL